MSQPVYSSADLIQNPGIFSGAEPPIRLSVFGNPVAHSLSPGMHNAALKASGIAAQYARILVEPAEANAAFKALPSAGFIGTNVTIPFKAEALAACDRLDDSAKLMGAVNTVVVEEQSLVGFNTDGPGLVRAIREEFSTDLRDLRVLLLGAGGAGRGIAVQCALEGCERLVLVNRTAEKAQELKQLLTPYFTNDRLIGPVERLAAIPWEENALRAQLANTDIVINATSLGMKRSDPPLLPQSLLTPNLLVYDTVYASGKSRLIEDAEAVGARAANGLTMLLHQGALSFEIWFNRQAPLDVMRAALRADTP